MYFTFYSIGIFKCIKQTELCYIFQWDNTNNNNQLYSCHNIVCNFYSQVRNIMLRKFRYFNWTKR